MEADDDVGVALGNAQIFHRFISLPSVGTDNNGAFGLESADNLSTTVHNDIPCFGVVGNGFVHQFVCHPFVGIPLQFAAQLAPAFIELFLCFFIGEKGLFCSIEVVGTQDVKVNDCTHLVLSAPLQCVVQQAERFRFLFSVGCEHLLFVNGYAKVVETLRSNECHVFFGEVVCPFRTAGSALRKPMADVYSAMQFDCSQGRCVAKCNHQGEND